MLKIIYKSKRINIVLTFVLAIFYISCSERKDDKLTFGEYEILYEDHIVKKQYDSIDVVFEYSFIRDTVKLFKDSNKIIERVIKTDDHLGFAYNYVVKLNPGDNIFFEFNHLGKLKLDSIKYFSNLYITKNDSNKMKLTFSNKKRRYM